MEITLSIAMATYNGGKFLREQLDSIYNQSLPPDEVIVCDDCSTDNTVKILEEYHQKHGLKYFVNENNIGYNKNFEKAISLCSGMYIAISDQDDVWLNNKLKLSLTKLKEIEEGLPAMVSTNKYSTDSNLDVIGYKNFKDLRQYHDAFFGPPSQGSTILLNRKLVNIVLPFPENQECIYDGFIAIVAAMCGNKYYIGEKLNKHRLHANNSFHTNNNKKTKISNYLDLYKNNRFFKLLPPGRYNAMKVVYEKVGNLFIEDRKLLFNRIIEIYESKSLFKSLLLILQIKEISIKRKLVIIVNSFIHKGVSYIN